MDQWWNSQTWASKGLWKILSIVWEAKLQNFLFHLSFSFSLPSGERRVGGCVCVWEHRRASGVCCHVLPYPGVRVSHLNWNQADSRQAPAILPPAPPRSCSYRVIAALVLSYVDSNQQWWYKGPYSGTSNLPEDNVIYLWCSFILTEIHHICAISFLWSNVCSQKLCIWRLAR